MTVVVKPNQPVIVIRPPDQRPVVIKETPTQIATFAGEKGEKGSTGATGPQGPQGPGTFVVPVAYSDWPPANPQADTLYLRLAP